MAESSPNQPTNTEGAVSQGLDTEVRVATLRLQAILKNAIQQRVGREEVPPKVLAMEPVLERAIQIALKLRDPEALSRETARLRRLVDENFPDAEEQYNKRQAEIERERAEEAARAAAPKPEEPSTFPAPKRETAPEERRVTLPSEVFQAKVAIEQAGGAIDFNLLTSPSESLPPIDPRIAAVEKAEQRVVDANIAAARAAEAAKKTTQTPEKSPAPAEAAESLQSPFDEKEMAAIVGDTVVAIPSASVVEPSEPSPPQAEKKPAPKNTVMADALKSALKDAHLSPKATQAVEGRSEKAPAANAETRDQGKSAPEALQDIFGDQSIPPKVKAKYSRLSGAKREKFVANLREAHQKQQERERERMEVKRRRARATGKARRQAETTPAPEPVLEPLQTPTQPETAQSAPAGAEPVAEAKPPPVFPTPPADFPAVFRKNPKGPRAPAPAPEAEAERFIFRTPSGEPIEPVVAEDQMVVPFFKKGHSGRTATPAPKPPQTQSAAEAEPAAIQSSMAELRKTIIDRIPAQAVDEKKEGGRASPIDYWRRVTEELQQLYPSGLPSYVSHRWGELNSAHAEALKEGSDTKLEDVLSEMRVFVTGQRTAAEARKAVGTSLAEATTSTAEPKPEDGDEKPKYEVSPITIEPEGLSSLTASEPGVIGGTPATGKQQESNEDWLNRFRLFKEKHHAIFDELDKLYSNKGLPDNIRLQCLAFEPEYAMALTTGDEAKITEVFTKMDAFIAEQRTAAEARKAGGAPSAEAAVPGAQDVTAEETIKERYKRRYAEVTEMLKDQNFGDKFWGDVDPIRDAEEYESLDHYAQALEILEEAVRKFESKTTGAPETEQPATVEAGKVGIEKTPGEIATENRREAMAVDERFEVPEMEETKKSYDQIQQLLREMSEDSEAAFNAKDVNVHYRVAIPFRDKSGNLSVESRSAETYHDLLRLRAAIPEELREENDPLIWGWRFSGSWGKLGVFADGEKLWNRLNDPNDVLSKYEKRFSSLQYKIENEQLSDEYAKAVLRGEVQTPGQAAMEAGGQEEAEASAADVLREQALAGAEADDLPRQPDGTKDWRGRWKARLKRSIEGVAGAAIGGVVAASEGLKAISERGRSLMGHLGARTRELGAKAKELFTKKKTAPEAGTTGAPVAESMESSPRFQKVKAFLKDRWDALGEHKLQKGFENLGDWYNKAPVWEKIALGVALTVGMGLTSPTSITAASMYGLAIISQRVSGLAGTFKQFEQKLTAVHEGSTTGRISNMRVVKWLASGSEKSRKRVAMGGAAASLLGISAATGFAATKIGEWYGEYLKTGEIGKQATATGASEAVPAPGAEPAVPAVATEPAPPPVTETPTAAPAAGAAPAPPEAVSPATGASDGSLERQQVLERLNAEKQKLDESILKKTIEEAKLKEISGLSAEAKAGWGVERMMKQLTEQLQRTDVQYPGESDAERLLQADGKSINNVIHEIAKERGFFNKDTGESMLVKLGDKLRFNDDGSLLFTNVKGEEFTNAPSGVPFTAPYTPGIAPVSAPIPGSTEELGYIMDRTELSQPKPTLPADDSSHWEAQSPPQLETQPPAPVEERTLPSSQPAEGVLRDSQGQPVTTERDEYVRTETPERLPGTNAFGIKVSPTVPHIYADSEAKQIFVFGGSPSERAKSILEYLTQNPSKVVFAPDDTGKYRIPWQLVEGKAMPGVAMRTSGFFGFGSTWVEPPRPDEFAKIIK